jgi:hypothetical protein
MIVFDGTYSWKGSTRTKKRPISWWQSSYELRVVDIAGGAPGVVFLKPTLAIFSDTGDGASVTNCLPDLAKQICDDFDLDLDRVVWVEHRPGATPRYRIAVFRQVARLHDEAFYQVDWRPASPNEIDLIHAHCRDSQ